MLSGILATIRKITVTLVLNYPTTMDYKSYVSSDEDEKFRNGNSQCNLAASDNGFII